MLKLNIKLNFLKFFLISLIATNASANPNQINNDIDAKLKNLTFSGRHDFDVQVKSGVVTLNGYVSNLLDKNRVIKAVNSVEGVKRVDSKLNIIGKSLTTNSDIPKTIRDKVKLDKSIQNYKLNIEHKDTSLILSGMVDNLTDKEKIFNIAYQVAPDLNIFNKLKIQKKNLISDETINQNVIEAIKAQNITAINNVVVKTENGIALFFGEVKNQREIDRMLSIALMVEGVKSVRSEVQIIP